MSKHVKIEGQQDGEIAPFSLEQVDNFVDKYVGQTKIEPKETFEGGATRSDSTGKGRFDLIPSGPLKRLAVRYEEGGRQHGDENWKNGQPMTRIFSALIRHAYQWQDGQDDEDHLAAVAWNVFALMYFEEKS